MEEDLHDIIVAGGIDEDIEAAILINILGVGEEAEAPNDQVHNRFNLDEVPPEQCKLLFRFEKEHLYRLCRVLNIPEFITTYNQNKVSGLTGLCMLLRRLAYPNRLHDLQNFFGYSKQALCLIINSTMNIINQNFGHLLSDLGQLQWLNHQRFQVYAQAIQEMGAAIPNCWGFIDGTARPICRPTVNQEDYFSGHKRYHCIKYQSVICPDGIIASLKGGWPGRRHDAAMFAESGLYDELERVAVFPNNEKYVLFGDQAYGIRELLLAPFANRNNLEPHQIQFNQSMRILRTSVEWGFQKVLSEFAFLDYKKNQKLLLQQLESMYKVAILLTNCHSTLYGNQTSFYFNTNPPSLEEYLGVI